MPTGCPGENSTSSDSL
uniref:Uncharacterized protein n=1 Tax=Anguilla anguilla TaxID=7936 RepID=A0A0E9UYG1_ANGAN